MRLIPPSILAALSGRASLGESTTATSAGVCPTVLQPSYNKPVVGAGWTAQLVATGLKSPRGILMDRNDALLVVQKGVGIQHITFNDNGGTCLAVRSSQALISFPGVSRGLLRHAGEDRC